MPLYKAATSSSSELEMYVPVELDFGAFPGTDTITETVTGLTGTGYSLTSSLLVFLDKGDATADHTKDEQQLEDINVRAEIIDTDSVLVTGMYCPKHRSDDDFRVYGKFNTTLVIIF